MLFRSQENVGSWDIIMKKLLAAIAVILPFQMNSVLAADIMPDPAYDWTGFYSGLHVGYGDFDGTYFIDSGAGNTDINGNGVVGGTLGGYNFQSDSIVFGIESDTTLTDLDDTIAGGAIDFDVNLESSLRGRLGVAFDRFMPFVTGGVALAHAKSDNSAVGDSDKNYHLGFVIGGGLEFAATDHVRLRAEYLYSDFGKETYNIGVFNDTAKWHQHVARAALIWAW